jgi:hypothetical protein
LWTNYAEKINRAASRGSVPGLRGCRLLLLLQLRVPNKLRAVLGCALK